jgi:hypothetical protein
METLHLATQITKLCIYVDTTRYGHRNPSTFKTEGIEAVFQVQLNFDALLLQSLDVQQYFTERRCFTAFGKRRLTHTTQVPHVVVTHRIM